jgi:hypothetical protein
MIWLTWRQHRAALIAGLGVLAALAAFLLASGAGLRRTYDDLGLNDCAAPIATSCPDLAQRFEGLYSGYQFLLPLFLILPVLVGVLWGAPLVAREIEHGTHRLVWTQSITRGRWLTVKVGVLAATAALGLALATWLLMWWVAPVMAVGTSRFETGMFDLLGVTPAAYGLAALAFGVAAGTFSRKLIPAIAITLVAFLLVRVAVDFGLRPHFMTPVTTSIPFPTAGAAKPAVQALSEDPGWIVSEQTVTADGRVVSDGIGFNFRTLRDSCPELAEPRPGQPPDAAATSACVQRIGLHVEVVYQPDDRYWRFQVTEAGIYLVLSAGLLGASAWWLRHRVA